MRPFHAFGLGVTAAVIGGALMAGGGDGAFVAGLLFVAVGAFLELVAAIAYGTVIAHRELQRPSTAPWGEALSQTGSVPRDDSMRPDHALPPDHPIRQDPDTIALLEYLDSADDRGQCKLQPIAIGLGMDADATQQLVNRAVEAGIVKQLGFTGKTLAITGPGILLLKDRES